MLRCSGGAGQYFHLADYSRTRIKMIVERARGFIIVSQ